MHFGPRHWRGNNDLLLEKLNSYSADLVVNTGDNTTDSLENEFEAAGEFLASIQCEHVISIVGNHDKRNMHAQKFFREHIDPVELIRPLDPEKCDKDKLFLDQYTTGIVEKLTDTNFVKIIQCGSETLLVVCLDTGENYQDNGYIDKEILRSVSLRIDRHAYDKIILLNHHSILETDSDPLFNSGRIIDFARQHNIEHVFCGHTHKLSLTRHTDLVHQHSFYQYKNGTLSSRNTPNDSNMFLFFENFAEENMKVHVIRIFVEGSRLTFEEEEISKF